VLETRKVYVSAMTSNTTNAYDTIVDVPPQSGNTERYEVYHLFKRGKQHIHAGVVSAPGPQEAMAEAKKHLRGDKLIYNVWVVRSSDIRFTTDEEKDLWITLPEKKFRDASDYKGGDKLKEFLERAK
jgi:ring-1,2-phenylacetyl-CoA epoxidase subunit PaaB